MQFWPHGFDYWSDALFGDHFPALSFRLRRTFADANRVTYVESIGFIVRPVFFGLTNGFLQNGVCETTFDRYGYGLFVGVAGHGALQDTLWHTITPLLGRASGFFVQNCAYTSGVTTDGFHASGILDLACGLLKTEVKCLFLQRCQVLAELVWRFITQFLSVHVSSF